MSLNVPLLRASFALVIERKPDLTVRFYEILFEQHPEAQELFGRHSQSKQAEMLATALVAVVDHLEDPAWLVETLGGLGERHKGYGVTAEMYGWVGGALLTTLAEVGGSDWTPELAAAWTDAYGAIASLMQRPAA